METFGRIRNPRIDDRPIWNITLTLMGGPALLAAHRLRLFPLLAGQRLTLLQVCESLRLQPRAAQALLGVVVALGFCRFDRERYSLTPVAEDYLLENSPTYFGGWLDFVINTYSTYAVESIEKAVLQNSQQLYGGAEWVRSHEEQADLARKFTRAMHSISIGPALAWPELIDLSRHRVMLDIGGGSGAHCIGATRKWPNLRAIVFDIAPVCEVAREFAAEYALRDRISTHAGDMWTDRFPDADCHFYSHIFHDWPVEKCELLARQSFERLPAGGRIIVHEILFDDDKSGPLVAAAMNMVMLTNTTGQQFSGSELSTMLSAAGFRDLEVKPVFGIMSIVTGRKP
jgi:O-methyltransferase domain/Dimerisation domain